MTENWKTIDGFDYEVSDAGRVRNIANGRYAEPFRSSKGSMYVYLRRWGDYKPHSLSMLVARAFVPNSYGAKTVRFKDGDNTNCRADNIEWKQPKAERKKDVWEISVEYKYHQKGVPCDITVLNTLNGMWCHATRTGDLAAFFGIKLKTLDKFLRGEHTLCSVWKIVPYEDARYKYTTMERIYAEKFDG